MQLLAIWLITGRIRDNQEIKKGVASVVRKTLPALKATALKDFEEILQSLGFWNSIKQNKTNKTYTFRGRTLEFFSVDDQQKVRGRKRQILFCNEANELQFKTDFFQLLIRTTDLIILDLNPSNPYVWVNTELEQKRAFEVGDVDTIISTYRDNPFLSESLKREIEGITDKQLRKVYVYGQYGVIKGLIYPDIKIVDAMPTNLKKRAVGLDFGYTNATTCAVMCGVQGDYFFIEELIYERGLQNHHIASMLPKNIEIYCDSAEPKSIQDLRDYGLWAKPARKGKDSILNGIGLLKKYNLCLTARSVNGLKEQKQYKYKLDANGDHTNQPIDNFNHFWDAVRYYGLMKLKQSGSILAYG
jgi:phage terminase large subunit